MNKLIAITLALLLAGCSAFSSPRTTLGTLQDAAIAARMTMRPVIDRICATLLAECQQEQVLEVALLTDEPWCPNYDTCDQIRMIIITTLEAVQFAIADANMALALGDEERYEDAVLRVGELLEEINLQMQMLGIIPGVEEEEDGQG